MLVRNTMRKRRRESGIALLIAIFILLLISVVAIALIVASGTESSLAGNYRSSTAVYYAALAGLEEARGRLMPKNPNSFQNTAPSLMPSNPLAVGVPVYIINPVPGETVAPWDPASLYPDTEYQTESGGIVPPNPSPNTLSRENSSLLQGPLYKWVRINAVSEQWINLDVDADNIKDNNPLYYDGTQLTISSAAGAGQVFEVTSYAVLPNGSQKLLQYLVAPTPLNLSFPAALALNGDNVQFATTTSNNFFIKGNDQYGALSCNPTPPAPPVTAVGFTNNSDSSQSTIRSAIPSGPSPTPDLRANYSNGVDTTPDVNLVTLSTNLTTVAGLNALVQTIEKNVDAPIINGPVTLSDSNNIMPSAMSPTNPMTIVVNGDLTINGWNHHGYGLLLVTGNLTYDPKAFWHGIVLVIGKGYFHSNTGSTTGGHIEGALFIAKTTDALGNPLPVGSPLEPPHFDFTSSSLTPSGSNYYGVYYSNCWIQAAMPSLGYKILSFHEIAQ